MLVLFLLVSAPLSALAQANDEAEASIDQTHEPVTVSEAERLATAASHWHLMPSAVQVAVEMAPSSGVLRLASGSFDPLLGDGPEVPTSFRASTMRRTQAWFSSNSTKPMETCSTPLSSSTT